MKELFTKYKGYIIVLLLPYILVMFILVYPVNYTQQTPGGLSEVEDLIEIDYETAEEIEGSISTTFIMSIKRPTFFQFMLGTFTDYSTTYVLSETQSNYTNEEIAQISYLDKEVSVDSAIIVAYLKAAETNDEINIEYELKVMVYGKAEYLDYYDDIDFGDEFISMMGDDDYLVTDYSEIGTYTQDSDSYQFTFKNEDGEYTLTLTKDEEYGLFGFTLKTYYIVNEETVYPYYTENESSIGGPSGGLLQTLSIYNMLVDEDLTNGLKIAGTGTISYDGSAGYIGGVEQKIITAYLNNVDVFFMPLLDEDYYYDNYIQALRVCEEYGLDPEGWLVPVSSFDDVLEYLEGLE